MFPLILTVLNRDYSRGYSNPYLRTVRIGGDIPTSTEYKGFGQLRAHITLNCVSQSHAVREDKLVLDVTSTEDPG